MRKGGEYMENLKRIIKEMGLTNSEFAESVNIKKSTFSDRINQKSEFKQSEIISILIFTGKEFKDIFLKTNSVTSKLSA